MVWQRIRIALLVCTVLAISASSALAQDDKVEQKKVTDKVQDKVQDKVPVEKIAPPTEKVVVPPITSAPTGCCTRTVYVTECVPETYTATRTVYRSECRTEAYTYYRCETFPEVRERTVCCTRRIPVMKTECRKVCVTVPVCEERTVMKPCYTYQNETTYKCRTCDRGHYECREVYSHRKAFSNWFGGLGKRHGHQSNDCCNPCPQQCCEAPCTKTVKVWVPCMVTEQVPVTCCKKVCTMVPTVCKVTCNRTEWRDQTFQVCTYQCVTESRVEKYTVCCTRKVACQGTRQVRVCVPCQETYTACRMVSRTVARQVADTTCCCNPCDPCCTTSSGGLFSRFGGLFNRGSHGHHQTSGCGGCCN